MPSIARVGDEHRGICGHGAPCCPHHVVGTITEGSPGANANSRPVARLLDDVVHNCPHCGIGHVASSSVTVRANGIGAARIGDTVVYPGGWGLITTASGDVNAGD